MIAPEVAPPRAYAALMPEHDWVPDDGLAEKDGRVGVWHTCSGCRFRVFILSFYTFDDVLRKEELKIQARFVLAEAAKVLDREERADRAHFWTMLSESGLPRSGRPNYTDVLAEDCGEAVKLFLEQVLLT